jgi:hypothetical protein
VWLANWTFKPTNWMPRLIGIGTSFTVNPPTRLPGAYFNACNICNSPTTGMLVASKPQLEEGFSLGRRSSAGRVRGAMTVIGHRPTRMK